MARKTQRRRQLRKSRKTHRRTRQRGAAMPLLSSRPSYNVVEQQREQNTAKYMSNRLQPKLSSMSYAQPSRKLSGVGQRLSAKINNAIQYFTEKGNKPSF